MIYIDHPPSSSRSAHLSFAQDFWTKHICPFDNVVDATVGGGYDTCFLANLLNGKGSLVGYDIQLEALDRTRKRMEQELNAEQRSIITLKLASHALLEEKDLAMVVYNLGYLPCSDKSCITQTQTTLTSLKLALQLLKSKGVLSIMCYPGHPGGREERDAILQWASQLPEEVWRIEYHHWPHRAEHAPSWLLIQRLI